MRARGPRLRTRSVVVGPCHAMAMTPPESARRRVETWWWIEVQGHSRRAVKGPAEKWKPVTKRLISRVESQRQKRNPCLRGASRARVRNMGQARGEAERSRHVNW